MVSIFFVEACLCPNMWSILKMFHMHMKRMYILFLWGERFYIYQLSPFDLDRGMSDLLVSLGHPGGIRAVLGCTLKTQTLMKTDEQIKRF